MRIYFDSSALVKRVITEVESDAVEAAIRSFADDGAELYSSALATIEIGRVLRSRGDNEKPERLVELSDAALSGIAELPMSDQIVSLARRIGPSTLRSLDAIHLASAVFADADLVVAFDRRMLLAASELGFRTASPS